MQITGNTINPTQTVTTTTTGNQINTVNPSANDDQYIADLLQRQSNANQVVTNYISQLIIIKRQKNVQIQILTEEKITLEQ